MKKITIVWLLLLIPSLLCSQELLTNGDLETGLVTPFVAGASGGISVNSTDEYAGTYSLNMGNDSRQFKQNITTVIGQTYRVGFYFKYNNSGVNTGGETFPSIRESDETTIIRSLTLPVTTTNWTYFTFTFTASSTSHVFFVGKNARFGGGTNNSARFDNMSIQPVVVPANGDDLISNGTLETGDLTGYVSVSSGIAVNVADKYAGTYSLNMGNDFRAFRQDFTATANVLYQVSFYFKYNNAGINAGGEAFPSIRLDDNTTQVASFGGMDVSSTDWTYFSMTFIAPQAALTFYVSKNNRNGGGTNNSARFDNISIKPIYEWTGNTDTDWSTASNWDLNSVPPTGASVNIPNTTNAPIISATTGVNVYDLDIDEPNDGLTINGGGSLDVDGTPSGNITYNRTLAANKWHLVGSPVDGETYNDDWVSNNGISSGTGNNRGVSWYDNATSDPTTGHWRYMQSMASDNFDSSAGYGLIRTTAGTVSFTGTYPTGSKPATVSNANTNKFNLVSNPYPTYLAVSEFFTDNATSKFTENTIWIWDQADNAYVPKTSASDGTFEIAPGQAFFISSGDGTDIIFYQFNGGSATDTFLKNNRTELSISINDGADSRTANLHYIDTATEDFDNGYDASLFNGVKSEFSIYTALLSDVQKSLSRQVLPITDMENLIIPIGIKADEGKVLNFTAEALNLPNDVNVFLEDRDLGVFTQLNSPNTNYNVSLSKNLNGIGRFYLHTTSSALSVDNEFLDSVSIYKMNDTTLKVAGLTATKASIKMFNILGKQMMITTIDTSKNNEVSLPKLPTGVYIVQLQTANGKLNKKIILE